MIKIIGQILIRNCMEVCYTMRQLSKRNSSFELVRIVGMLLIVSHHLVAHGIINMTNADMAYVVWRNGSAVNKLFSCGLMMGGVSEMRCLHCLQGISLSTMIRLTWRK